MPFATIHYVRAKGECHAVMSYSSFHGETLAMAASEAPISCGVLVGHWRRDGVEASPRQAEIVWPCGSIRGVPPTSIQDAAAEANWRLERPLTD